MGFFSSLFGGGLGSLSVKHRAGNVGKGKESIDGLDILIKGNLYPTNYSNVPTSCRVHFSTTLKDASTDEPIHTKIHDLQMGTEDPTYYFYTPGPSNPLSKDMGYSDWVDIGFVPSEEHLISPYQGSRSIEISVNCLSEDYIILSSASLRKTMFFDGNGYLELDEDSLEIQKAAIKLAADIAYSDGTLDRAEGNIIKKYAKQKIEISLDEFKPKIKRALNNAIETGFNQAENRKTNRSLLTSKVKDKSNNSSKEELLNLCLEVMAIDGVADNNELKILEEIATNIGFDYKQFMSLRDKRMIGLKNMSNEEDLSDISAMERTIGIKSDWTKTKKRNHCKKEFRKWNGRLASLKGKQEQDNAQKILDIIGILLKHYKK